MTHSDNIEAREWINQTVHENVEYDADGNAKWHTVVPYIDGGSEGFSGQARVVVPSFTACFKCGAANFAEQKTYPMCTVRNIPRLPEHSVMYALDVLWPSLRSFQSAAVYELPSAASSDQSEEKAESVVPFDGDNNEHMSWLYNRSVERARQFGIQEPSFELTMKVAKNIIPAIASTNALISAACCNEGLFHSSLCVCESLIAFSSFSGVLLAISVQIFDSSFDDT